MLKKIIIALIAVIAVFLIVVAVQPDRSSVERSAVLDAPPDVLFAQVNNQRKFTEWDPFTESDPNSKSTFTGPESGVGSVCSWVGEKTGTGSSTITESKPNELVRFRMDWVKPMSGTSTVDFTFEPKGDKTLVTWKMYGPQNFAGKAFSLFMDMEDMCGPMFEKGLKNLEKAAKNQIGK